MPDATPRSADQPTPPGVLARASGVLLSPRATYASVAARPQALGVLALVLAVIAGSTGTLLSTEVGQSAYVDQALTVMEGFGVPVSDQVMARLEAQARYAVYTTVGGQLIVLPLLAALVAGLSLGVFNAVLGADGTFRQAFAIVVHSSVIVALQSLFSAPLSYARESLSSTTSLIVFFPMVDDASIAGRLLGSIDLFRIWWIASLSIGFGVLYKRRTGPIAWSLLTLYVGIMLVIAGVRSVLSGV